MELENVKQQLETVNAYLAKQDAVRDEALSRIDAEAVAESGRIGREIRILNQTIDDAKRRRRWRVVESLVPKVDEQIGLISSLESSARAAKLEVHRLHRTATSDERMLQKRLLHVLETAAAMERQREMQVKRHRKIPVMR